MADIDVLSYKEIYVKTAQQYLDAMFASFVLLFNDNDNFRAIETMYRSAYSLKTQSLLMGYKNTAFLNEFIEHICRNVKEGNIDFTEKNFTDIETALQKIENSVISIDELNKELTLQHSLVN